MRVSCWVTLSKLFNLSNTQFFHCQWGYNNIEIIALLQSLDETVILKYIAQCLIHSKLSIKIIYCYCCYLDRLVLKDQYGTNYLFHIEYLWSSMVGGKSTTLEVRKPGSCHSSDINELCDLKSM